MRAQQDYGTLATGLAQMARELLSQNSVQGTLDRVVEHAVKLVDGCDAAGILRIRKGQVSTLASTDQNVEASDRLQADTREGPCLDVTVHRSLVYRIEDVHQPEPRWPHYTEQIRQLGVGSVMGFLLYSHTRDNLGALNLYSAQRGGFTESSEHVGWVLASHAAVALASAQHLEHLDSALASSRIIGEAIGVVMSRYKLSEDAAFDAIRRTSQDRNIKVRDLARRITEIGEIPGR